MIKIEYTEVYGWNAAIRGMRNAYESWDKSDSTLCRGGDGFKDCTISPAGECPRNEGFGHDVFCIGKNDFDLMRKLIKGGASHRKFMRQIIVWCDIVAPRYWWTEADTYRFGKEQNSSSTMHRIHAREITLDDFSHDQMWGECDQRDVDEPVSVLNVVVDTLNYYREAYLETKEKLFWWQMVQLLPQSYNQRRTMLFSYETLRKMYHERKAHKLDEWREFCGWVETLPYAELITEV